MTSQKSKLAADIDFMPYWNNEEQCCEEAKVEGKDLHGKKVSTHWPRDMPQAQIMYELWLKKVKDPDTGEFYPSRDPKTGNVIKGPKPKHIIRQIVRFRAAISPPSAVGELPL